MFFEDIKILLFSNCELVDFTISYSMTPFGRLYFYAFADSATIVWYWWQPYCMDSRLKERSYVVFSDKRSRKCNKMAKRDSAKSHFLTIPLPRVLRTETNQTQT